MNSLSTQGSGLLFSKVAAHLVHSLESVVNFQDGHFPIKYLGVPLSSSRLWKDDFCPLVEKIEWRIEMWGSKHFSFSGQLQLIKSILLTYQTYWSSMFVLPAGVVKEIEGNLRRFLWGGTADRFIARVSWQQICKPVATGGLGVPSIAEAYRAFICKHLYMGCCEQQ
ncbi:hypothetical protein Salat_1471300 [Sesamum alatum]|uniref:Reverse transcriptase n=1 Tax=Sesamum alatum TaxID=300844 RepID=A0AAE2CM70_9LAMI|nr:hypothetical protein Salat_1471300 [Sesamum alatum]